MFRAKFKQEPFHARMHAGRRFPVPWKANGRNSATGTVYFDSHDLGRGGTRDHGMYLGTCPGSDLANSWLSGCCGCQR